MSFCMKHTPVFKNTSINDAYNLAQAQESSLSGAIEWLSTYEPSFDPKAISINVEDVLLPEYERRVRVILSEIWAILPPRVKLDLYGSTTGLADVYINPFSLRRWRDLICAIGSYYDDVVKDSEKMEELLKKKKSDLSYLDMAVLGLIF